MKKINIAAISLLILILSGCRTTAHSPSSRFVYSIRDAELRGTGMEFSFVNHSSRTVKNFTLYIKLAAYDTDGSSFEISPVEKKIICNIESLEKADISFDIKELCLSANDFSEDIEELFNEGNVYVQRIYAKEITFDGDLLWYDKYGNWSF